MLRVLFAPWRNVLTLLRLFSEHVRTYQAFASCAKARSAEVEELFWDELCSFVFRFRHSDIIYQTVLTDSELKRVFKNAPKLKLNSEVVANEDVRKKYRQATGKEEPEKDETGRRTIDDDCPIWYVYASLNKFLCMVKHAIPFLCLSHLLV